MNPYPDRAAHRSLAVVALLAVGLLAPSACGSKATVEQLPSPDLTRVPAQSRTQIAQLRATVDASADQADDVRVAAFMAVGRYYQANDLSQAAERSYRNVLALAPEDFEARYLLAHVLRERNDFAAAAQAFEAALELRPRDAPARYWMANSLSSAGKSEEARAILEALVADEPGHAAALVALAKLEQAAGDHQAAVTHLESARRLAPTATEINYPLGLAYRALGRADEANALLAARGEGKAPLVDEFYADVVDLVAGASALLTQAKEAYDAGDLENAEAAFRQVLVEEPDNIAALENLGVVLTQKGALDEAAAVLERAARQNPGGVSIQFALGTALARAGRTEDAVAALERAVALDPAHAGAHFNLANNLWRLDRKDEARSHYQAVIGLQPNNPEARLLEATLLVKTEHWAEAEQALVGAATAVPDHPRLVESLARLRAASPQEDQRDGAAALAMADRLIRSTADINSAVVRAMALAELGRYEEAVAMQEEALRAARAESRTDLEPSLQFFLDRYQAGEPARQPWAPDDPLMPKVR